MISAGTGICGGSAIAAIAPVIDADDKDIAFALSSTFIFDMVMVALYPIMGKLLGMSDIAYGIWAGTSVNDTASVVASGYAFSELAGDFATMVKLTRTIAIIPTVLVFAYIGTRIKQKELKSKNSDKKVNIIKIIPWFIGGFLLLAILKYDNDITYKLTYIYEVDDIQYSITTDYGTNYIPEENSIREVKYNPSNPEEALLVGTNNSNSLIYFGLFFVFSGNRKLLYS